MSADPFRKLASLLDALPTRLEDDTPLQRVMPRLWPTVGDLRAAFPRSRGENDPPSGEDLERRTNLIVATIVTRVMKDRHAKRSMTLPEWDLWLRQVLEHPARFVGANEG